MVLHVLLRKWHTVRGLLCAIMMGTGPMAAAHVSRRSLFSPSYDTAQNAPGVGPKATSTKQLRKL